MSSLRSAAVVALVALSVPAGVAAEASSTPSAPDAPGASGAPTLYLDGPFGRVRGGPVGGPAPGPSTAALDAFVRHAPMGLVVEPDSSIVQRWQIELVSDGEPIVLAAGGPFDDDMAVAGFAGPGEAGRYSVIGTIVTTTGSRHSRAWRITVPDRPFPDDGVLDIPAPQLLLSDGTTTIAGAQGEGCYIFLCVIVGDPPPVESMGSLTVPASSDLELTLSDGSGFTIVEATLEPIDGADEPLELGSERLSGSRVALTDVPAGAWLLSVEVAFDRSRGQMRTLYRLLPADPAA